ncbi:MAG: hypothetical protein AAGA16_13130 [Cyanobacteria bacterium P01_E01_bin.35]
MNKNICFPKSSFTVKQLLFVILFLESLAITIAITKAITLGISPKTFFGEVNRGGFITYISGLQLLIAAVLSKMISKIVKSAQQLSNSRWFWLIIFWGLLFLTLDDLIGIHESLDYWLHNLFQFKETKLSDLADDLIVGGYLVIFLIYVAFQWQIIKGFRQSFIWFKLGFILTAVMVVLDMASNNTLFVSMMTDDVDLASAIQQWLGVIEDSAKIYAEGMFIVGIYKCWQIAKISRNN